MKIAVCPVCGAVDVILDGRVTPHVDPGLGEPCRGVGAEYITRLRGKVMGNPLYTRAPDGRRDHDVRVPVSAGELGELRRRASGEGVTLAEYLRRRGLG